MLGWEGRWGRTGKGRTIPCRAAVLLFWSIPESTCLMSRSLPGQGNFSNNFQRPALCCSISWVFCKHQLVREKMTPPLSRDNG